MNSRHLSSARPQRRRLANAGGALLLAASVLSALPASAESPGSIELGVFGGYDLKHETNELGNSKDRLEVPQAPASAWRCLSGCLWKSKPSTPFPP